MLKSDVMTNSRLQACRTSGSTVFLTSGLMSTLSHARRSSMFRPTHAPRATRFLVPMFCRKLIGACDPMPWPTFLFLF